jgi:hypothetical protein
MNDLLGGHLDTIFSAYAAVQGMIETKKVQAIARSWNNSGILTS